MSQLSLSMIDNDNNSNMSRKRETSYNEYQVSKNSRNEEFDYYS